MKTKLPGMLVIMFGLFLCAGAVSASDTEILQPAGTITYNEDLTVNGTGRFDSIYIGKQGVGGVTFFNGTIINATTGEGGSDNPVTIGDQLRVDGFIYGGPNMGNATDQALKIADTILPGSTNVNDIGSSSLKWRNLYLAGGLNTKNAAFTGNVDFTGSTVTGLASEAHNHDNRYYTKTQSDGKYALTTHNHDGRYYTKTQSNDRYYTQTQLNDGQLDARYYTKTLSDGRYALISHNHSATHITSGTLAVARGGTGISSYTANNYIRASGATTLQQRTPAQVRTDIGALATTGGTITGNLSISSNLTFTGPSSVVSFNTPKAYDYVVSSAECIAQRNVDNSDYHTKLVGDDAVGGSNYYRITCPLNLPHQATIINFAGYLLDSNSTAGYNSSCYLDRRFRTTSGDPSSGGAEATITTPLNTGWQNVTDTTITNPIVNNNSHIYYITCSGRSVSSLGMSYVKVTYSKSTLD